MLGLFPYGPAAGIGGDATNEIDIEYSRWGQANGPNGDWTDYPASGTTIGELATRSRSAAARCRRRAFHWSSTSITNSLLGGLQPVDGTTGLIKTWTYAPQNPTTNIPQQALPLGMNLWCFDAPPSDGKSVEIVIRDFVFEGPGDGRRWRRRKRWRRRRRAGGGGRGRRGRSWRTRRQRGRKRRHAWEALVVRAARQESELEEEKGSAGASGGSGTGAGASGSAGSNGCTCSLRPASDSWAQCCACLLLASFALFRRRRPRRER